MSAGSDRGRFITFEGGEGTGKTTQIRLLEEHLRQVGYEVLVLREPGSTPIGEKIRSILLDPGNGEMDPTTELLLYEASRAQMVREVVQPAVSEGKVVLCDRFKDSSMAYQGYGRGLGKEKVAAADSLAIGDFDADLTILLERDTEVALDAARVTSNEPDRIEQEPIEFHDRVRMGFLELAESNPDRVRRVKVREGDAEGTHRAVLEEVLRILGDGPHTSDDACDLTSDSGGAADAGGTVDADGTADSGGIDQV